MKTFNIKFCNTDITVIAEVEEPERGDCDNPDFKGEIDIQEILHNGDSIYDLVSEIPNFEEKIINKIRETL